MPVFEWSGEMASYGKTLYDTVPDRDGLRRPFPGGEPAGSGGARLFHRGECTFGLPFPRARRMGRTVEELTFVECNEHTRPEELPSMLEPLFGGRDAGFISEAGVPGVADPGAEIAALCHRAGIRVVPLVGPLPSCWR